MYEIKREALASFLICLYSYFKKLSQPTLYAAYQFFAKQLVLKILCST